jgi:hypothetical protein
MADWETLPRGAKWAGRPLFSFETKRGEVVERVGPPHAVDLDSNGCGPVDAWGLRFACGLEVVLWVFHIRMPEGRRVGDDELAVFEVQANEADEAHIRFHLPFALEAVSWWMHEPPLQRPPASWVVWRQDDNGNRFEVGACTSRCEAAETAATFESRGHKQTYWVEKRSSGN